MTKRRASVEQAGVGDEASLGDQSRPTGRAASDDDSELRVAISNAVVKVHVERFGKGPTQCKTYLDDDFVTCVLWGGYSEAERTIHRAGGTLTVRDSRHAMQDASARHFITAVEKLTDRNVEAFISGSHQDPDLTIEIFLLANSEPRPDSRDFPGPASRGGTGR